MKLGWICLLSLVGCPDPEGDTQVTAPDDINAIWDVSSQSCNGAPVALGNTLFYKLDDSYLVRVDVTAEDDARHCRTAYAYSQIVSSDSAGAELRRSATLTAAGTKTQCWTKQNGMRVEPPTNETGTFGPETHAMMMTATERTVTLDISDAPACKSGPLHIVLTRR